MANLIGYVDAAGSESHDDVIVACVAISDAEDWDAFDREWGSTMINDFGVRHFHMMDYAHFKGEYADWRDQPERRQRFLETLIRLTNERVQRLYVTTLVLNDFRLVDTKFRATETFGGPYAMAAAFSILSAAEWLFEEKEGDDGLAMFVEKGDVGQSAFMRTMDEQFDGKAAAFVHLTSKRTPAGEDIRPLHVPDFIAYEYRSEHAVFAKTGRTKPRPRGALAGIRKMLFPSVGVVFRNNLERMCVEAKVPLR
jgi:hypothetical protein